MEVSKIIVELDKEIARLKEARALLMGTSASPYRGSREKKTAAKPGKKRTMSADGRRRIAEAMKKRWAERKKQGTRR